MNTIDAITTRRAVKHYDPNHRISAEDEQKLFELAMQAPTAFNLQHWRFVVIKDPDLRKKIREVAWDQAQVTDASLLVVLTGDLKAWEKYAADVWKNAPKEVQDMLVPAIGQYYKTSDTVQRDEVMRSSGIAGQTLMLAATEMGYQSCPMDGFDFDAVANLIDLPEDHAISFMIAIGKGTKDPWPKPGQLPYEQVVIEDRFE